MLRKRQKHFVLLWLMVFIVFTVGCNGNATSQVAVASPSDISKVKPATNTSVPPTEMSISPQDTPIPPTEAKPPYSPTPTVELPFEIVRISLSNGDLSTQLTAEVQKAYALGYTPVVEFDAPW